MKFLKILWTFLVLMGPFSQAAVLFWGDPNQTHLTIIGAYLVLIGLTEIMREMNAKLEKALRDGPDED